MADHTGGNLQALNDSPEKKRVKKVLGWKDQSDTLPGSDSPPGPHCAAPVKTNMFSMVAQLSQAVSSQVTYPHTHPVMPPFTSVRSNLHDSIPIVQIKGRD